ncbi:hypothetical protein M422DRAFT_267149 [Sphaerobolus stellatus SS14]|uniref:Uncharacterized protein n=1 Tax=Sphaerobolus stellatus (strain SS14) TaxID=990650 RepID=A0A0C9U9J6_SPHS4|nr:hypothetical protein M422DRAFT_267149 [Sphaerobolus stellatus SS14]
MIWSAWNHGRNSKARVRPAASKSLAVPATKSKLVAPSKPKAVPEAGRNNIIQVIPNFLNKPNARATVKSSFLKLISAKSKNSKTLSPNSSLASIASSITSPHASPAQDQTRSYSLLPSVARNQKRMEDPLDVYIDEYGFFHNNTGVILEATWFSSRKAWHLRESNYQLSLPLLLATLKNYSSGFKDGKAHKKNSEGHWHVSYILQDDNSSSVRNKKWLSKSIPRRTNEPSTPSAPCDPNSSDINTAATAPLRHLRRYTKNILSSNQFDTLCLLITLLLRL